MLTDECTVGHNQTNLGGTLDLIQCTVGHNQTNLGGTLDLIQCLWVYPRNVLNKIKVNTKVCVHG